MCDLGHDHAHFGFLVDAPEIREGPATAKVSAAPAAIIVAAVRNAAGQPPPEPYE